MDEHLQHALAWLLSSYLASKGAETPEEVGKAVYDLMTQQGFVEVDGIWMHLS